MDQPGTSAAGPVALGAEAPVAGSSAAPLVVTRTPMSKASYTGMEQNEGLFKLSPAIEMNDGAPASELIISDLGWLPGRQFWNINEGVEKKALNNLRADLEDNFAPEHLRMGKRLLWVKIDGVLGWSGTRRDVKDVLQAYESTLRSVQGPTVHGLSWTRLLNQRPSEADLRVPRPEDVVCVNQPRGSLQALCLKVKGFDGRTLLTLDAEDKSVTIYSLTSLLLGAAAADGCYRSVEKVLVGYLQAHYPADDQNTLVLPSRQSAFDGSGLPLSATGSVGPRYIIPSRITFETARWFIETHEPLQSIRDLFAILYEVSPLRFTKYEGPRRTASRQDIVNLVGRDVRQLAFLTHSIMVTDSNAFDTLDIQALRRGVEPAAQADFLAPTYTVIQNAIQDPFVREPNANYSTLRLPLPQGATTAPKWGLFEMGSTDHPMLGCHLCDFVTPGGVAYVSGSHAAYAHKNIPHAVFLEDWRAASACWDVLLINTSAPGRMQDLKRTENLWSANYEPLGDADSELLAHFGKKGDKILWFVFDRECIGNPTVDALADITGDTCSPGLEGSRKAGEVLIYLFTTLRHVLRPAAVSHRIHFGGSNVATDSIVELLRSYSETLPLLVTPDFSELLAQALFLLCEPTSDASDSARYLAIRSDNRKIVNRAGAAVGGALWPLTFSTLRLERFGLMLKTGIFIREDKKYMVIEIFRRTRGGGWERIGYIIVAFGSWANVRGINMLNRYLENGDLRHRLISKDYGIDPKDLPRRRILFNGLEADTPSFQPDADFIAGWRNEKGEDVQVFDDYRPYLESNGSYEGRTLILSISGYDGFLATPTAILQALGHWTDGILCIVIDIRTATGISNYQSSGFLQNVHLEVPAFCAHIRNDMARARIMLLEKQKESCIHPTEIQHRDAEIAIEKAKIAVLNPDHERLFDEVLRNMRTEVEIRSRLRSARNVFGSAGGHQGTQMADELDDSTDISRYGTE